MAQAAVPLFHHYDKSGPEVRLERPFQFLLSSIVQTDTMLALSNVLLLPWEPKNCQTDLILGFRGNSRTLDRANILHGTNIITVIIKIQK